MVAGRQDIFRQRPPTSREGWLFDKRADESRPAMNHDDYEPPQAPPRSALIRVAEIVMFVLLVSIISIAVNGTVFFVVSIIRGLP
jgi:hypothetical protein